MLMQDKDAFELAYRLHCALRLSRVLSRISYIGRATGKKDLRDLYIDNITTNKTFI
jgi:hypothetical protein